MSKLHRAIDRLDGEWDVYVPMYVNEVKYVRETVLNIR